MSHDDVMCDPKWS